MPRTVCLDREKTQAIMKVLNRILTVALVVAVTFVGGRLLWTNLRAPDPLLAGWQDYSAPTFEEAIRNGGPVIVEAYASWCPTCIVQHQAFERLWSRRSYPGVTFIRIDYDRDSAFRDSHGIEATGLLLHFENGQEIERRGGLTSETDIEAFLDRILADKPA